MLAALVAALGITVTGAALPSFPITLKAANGYVRIEQRPVRIVSLWPDGDGVALRNRRGCAGRRRRRPVELPRVGAAHEAVRFPAEQDVRQPCEHAPLGANSLCRRPDSPSRR
jgi:hypothetical protein